jgi:hypothetical protein
LPSSPTTGMQVTCIFWWSEWKALVTLNQMVVVSCRRRGSAARGWARTPWRSDERSVVQVDRLRECAHQDALDETFQYFLGVTDMTSSLYRHNFVSFY